MSAFEQEEEEEEFAEEEEGEEEEDEEVEEPESFFPQPTTPVAAQTVSSATQKWKQENASRLQAKDQEYAAFRKSLTDKANKTLQQIQTDRQARIAAKAKENRAAQAKHQAVLASASSASGEISWKKMSVLVDLDTETKEKERMRLLFKDRVASA